MTSEIAVIVHPSQHLMTFGIDDRDDSWPWPEFPAASMWPSRPPFFLACSRPMDPPIRMWESRGDAIAALQKIHAGGDPHLPNGWDETR
jgi:hypothetical protein